MQATLFSGEALAVYIPGTLGDFGVLPGHEPFISTIRLGVIAVESEGAKLKIAVTSGIAEVAGEHCNVLIESALDVTSLSAADAGVRVSEAKALLADADNDAERKAAEQKLAMAEAILFAA
ncbi:MAG: ATP synthase F1 subunit epsilon [Alphaproteobacteria bacterium]|nr:ATP synthase F1 subunit epsilon [Alphaproteobacteria bacterium]